MCSPYWWLWHILSYEPVAPSFDHFVKVSGPLDSRFAELSDLFPYVSFLCFS